MIISSAEKPKPRFGESRTREVIAERLNMLKRPNWETDNSIVVDTLARFLVDDVVLQQDGGISHLMLEF